MRTAVTLLMLLASTPAFGQDGQRPQPSAFQLAKQRPPESRQLAELRGLQQELLWKHKSQSGDEQSDTKGKLFETLSREFDLLQEADEKKAEQLKARLDRLAEHMKSRKQHRELIILNRLAELLGERPPLSWNANGTTPWQQLSGYPEQVRHYATLVNQGYRPVEAQPPVARTLPKPSTPPGAPSPRAVKAIPRAPTYEGGQRTPVETNLPVPTRRVNPPTPTSASSAADFTSVDRLAENRLNVLLQAELELQREMDRLETETPSAPANKRRLQDRLSRIESRLQALNQQSLQLLGHQVRMQELALEQTRADFEAVKSANEKIEGAVSNLELRKKRIALERAETALNLLQQELDKRQENGNRKRDADSDSPELDF